MPFTKTVKDELKKVFPFEKKKIKAFDGIRKQVEMKMMDWSKALEKDRGTGAASIACAKLE